MVEVIDRAELSHRLLEREFDLQLPEEAAFLTGAARRAGRRIGIHVLKAARYLKQTERGQTIRLARRSLAELGLAEGVWRLDKVERLKDYGLGLCPQQTALVLGAHYSNQPQGEWLLVASPPIQIANGTQEERIFRVIHDREGPVIHAPYYELRHYYHPAVDQPWPAKTQCLFRLLD